MRLLSDEGRRSAAVVAVGVLANALGVVVGMTPSDLASVGSALHGHQWQCALARDLGVDARTMRRYAAGALPFPERLRGRLPGLLTAKRAEIEKILENLPPIP